MSTVVIIPLENNKDVAALVADKQPGDKLYACGTIKANDDQTLTFRIEEVTDNKAELPDKEDYVKKEEGEEEESNGSTEGEADEAAELASPGGMDEV